MLENSMPKRAIPITLICECCGSQYAVSRGRYNQTIKLSGRPPRFCSMKCMGDNKAGVSQLPARKCQHCGMEYRAKQDANGIWRFPIKFCSRECHYEFVRQQDRHPEFPEFKANKRVAKHGYVRLIRPWQNGAKREAFEHRVVMEKHLGRCLKSHETVHHKNGDRADNRIENLELFSSRHGPGQRVSDRLRFYTEFLNEYGIQVCVPDQSALISGVAGLI